MKFYLIMFAVVLFSVTFGIFMATVTAGDPEKISEELAAIKRIYVEETADHVSRIDERLDLLDEFRKRQEYDEFTKRMEESSKFFREWR